MSSAQSPVTIHTYHPWDLVTYNTKRANSMTAFKKTTTHLANPMKSSWLVFMYANSQSLRMRSWSLQSCSLCLTKVVIIRSVSSRRRGYRDIWKSRICCGIRATQQGGIARLNDNVGQHGNVIIWWKTSRVSARERQTPSVMHHFNRCWTNPTWNVVFVRTNLISANPNDVAQLEDHKIDAFQARLFESGNLLFDYSLKSHVRREETNANTWKLRQNWI